MDEIRVASLNCWGLKYVSKDRNERIAAIAGAFSNAHYDIIALQEIWVEADYIQVRDKVSHRLPYAKLFHSGALGSGLAIFTKWPIMASSITPYSLNGEPIDVSGGDWFVGKAVGSVTIFHPTIGEVQIFNTHLYAKGGEDGPEYNRAHRLVNAWEFAKVIQQAVQLGRCVIATGDFNSVPTSLPMNIILDHTGLSDAWAVSHLQVPPPSTTISPIDGVTLYGVTADSPLNTYRDSEPSGDALVRKYQGKRLDYILFRGPRLPSDQSTDHRLECKNSSVIFTEPIPGNTCSYSDHFGVEATLVITSEGLGGSDVMLKDAEPSGVSPATTSEMLGALQAYYRLSQDRSRRELTTFALSILLLFGLTVGSAWVPLPSANPIFIMFTVLVAWFSTTMLYEGFIFGNWERKALQNVIEELELYKKTTVDKRSRVREPL
ncbi:Endonuclease/exonuclease/phosphatase [Phlebopus sp. FC_14]|nr:Endonuclease/exonuclease/phosphatase [Phlebopus sp. FC_14]